MRKEIYEKNYVDKSLLLLYITENELDKLLNPVLVLKAEEEIKVINKSISPPKKRPYSTTSKNIIWDKQRQVTPHNLSRSPEYKLHNHIIHLESQSVIDTTKHSNVRMQPEPERCKKCSLLEKELFKSESEVIELKLKLKKAQKYIELNETASINVNDSKAIKERIDCLMKEMNTLMDKLDATPQ